MGADLIGYLLKGPRDLPEEKRAAAVECVVNALNLLNQAAIDHREGRGISPEAQKIVDRSLMDIDYELEDFEDERPGAIQGRAENLVTDLYAVWNGSNARDLYCRIDPDDDTQLLFFCGDMSWGDSPDGFAYETIGESHTLGLLEFFNIR